LLIAHLAFFGRSSCIAAAPSGPSPPVKLGAPLLGHASAHTVPAVHPKPIVNNVSALSVATEFTATPLIFRGLVATVLLAIRIFHDLSPLNSFYGPVIFLSASETIES